MSAATMTDPFSATVPTPGQATELVAEGDYVGALVALIDLGTQKNDYKGEEKEQRQVYLIFELDDEDSNGKRHLVGQQYTLSLNERAGLRAMIEKTQKIKLEPGQKFDYRTLLGKSFNVLISNTKTGDRTYHRIAKDGIGPLHRKDDPIPRGNQREHFVYAVSMGAPPDLSWAPYLYGRPVAEVIAECKEFAGGDQAPANTSAAKPAPSKGRGIAQAERIAREIAEMPAGLQRDARQADLSRVLDEAGITDDEYTEFIKDALIPF